MRGSALTWRFGRGRMCRLRGMRCSSHLHTGAVVGLQLTSWESYHCEHVTLNNRITVAQGFAGLSIRGCNGPNGPRMSGNLSTSSGGNIRSVPIAFALSLPSARWSSVGATNVGVSTSSQGFGDLSLDAAGNTYVLFLMPPTTFPSLVCASQQRCGEDFQTPRIATGIEQKKYADICASAGLRPIIGGTIMMNTPGYC